MEAQGGEVTSSMLQFARGEAEINSSLSAIKAKVQIKQTDMIIGSCFAT